MTRIIKATNVLKGKEIIVPEGTIEIGAKAFYDAVEEELSKKIG